jgi:hypothetical protein
MAVLQGDCSTSAMVALVSLMEASTSSFLSMPAVTNSKVTKVRTLFVLQRG